MKEDAEYSSIGISHYGVARYGIQASMFSTLVKQFEKLPSSNKPFTTMINQLENLPNPHKITIGGSPQMIIGGNPEIRVGVYTEDFEKLKKRFEKV